MRAHGLPLPYLTVPSLSFLVHVSPRAYLTLLRSSSTSVPTLNNNPLLPILDVPFSHIRSHVASYPRPEGVTTANLVFATSHESLLTADDPSMGFDGLSPRPIFSLVPSGGQKDVYFPQVNDKTKTTHGYVLDFTDGGTYPGVVMSQTRMEEIQMVLNPLGSLAEVTNMSMTPFGSWVDMLVCANLRCWGA